MKNLDVKLSNHQIPISVGQGNTKIRIVPYFDNPATRNCFFRFDCPDFRSLDENVCHWKGKTYKQGTVVDDNTLPSCVAQCHCSKYADRSAELQCANIECPHHFSPQAQSCVSQYNNLKACCPTSQVCGN